MTNIDWNLLQDTLNETGIYDIFLDDVLSSAPTGWSEVKWTMNMEVHTMDKIVKYMDMAKVIVKFSGTNDEAILVMLSVSHRKNDCILAVIYEQPVRYFRQSQKWMRAVSMTAKYSAEYGNCEDEDG